MRLKLFFFSLMQLSLAVDCLAQLPIELKLLSGTNGWGEQEISKNFNACIDNDVKAIFLESFKVTDSEWVDYCSCLTEKYVTRHERVNGVIQNLSKEISGRYGADCYVDLGLVVKSQERVGQYSKPGHSGLSHNKNSELSHLVNVNGFNQGLINDTYEGCLNNSALIHEFKQVGHSDTDYNNYCKCVVESMVRGETNGPQLTSEFLQRLEIYSNECYRTLF